jgi:predicted GIY-YIG superfamily endonuclease
MLETLDEEMTAKSTMKTQLYRHFDSAGVLLYVGISLSTFARLRQHKDHSRWFEKVATVSIENFDTREKAMAAERKAIKTESPQFNIAMKKTLAEIAREEKELLAESRRSYEEGKKLLQSYVQYNLAYQLDEVRQMLGMTKGEIEKHVATGKLCTFEVEGKKSYQPVKMKQMVSGWSLIDFVDYLERRNK